MTSTCSRTLVWLGLGVLLTSPASAQRFLADDPVWRDRDDLHVEKPSEVELSTTWDAIENTFASHPSRPIPAAVNVNTLGEVPDSSWFENRIGVRPMSIEELVRGPNRLAGPDVEREWRVIGGKSSGISPGFTIRDARGDLYFIKFDPARYPNLSTGADVVSTKFFYAFGYHVPENYVAYFRPGQLRIAPGAKLRVPNAKRRAMTQADLDTMLENVARLPDGRIRCVASRGLEGEPLGPHKYHGTRGDDPNDVFAHEDRRDLRALRVFSAWLNHDDSRAINSLDMYVTEAGRSYVKHHLIDFGSTLGSGSDARRRIAPQNPRAGNEYVFEAGPLLKTALTLGIWERPWRKVDYEVYPEVGRIEASFFEPESWKPEYPNPAFDSLLPEDAFWAARIVAKLSDEAIRAIVHTGEYRDAAAEGHLADMIIRRRDKVIAYYLRLLNPLAEFRVAGATDGPILEFVNAGEQAGLASVEGYEYQWFTFDNISEGREPLADVSRAREPRIPLPDAPPDFLLVRIRALSTEPAWGKHVDVYLRNNGAFSVVGIERES